MQSIENTILSRTYGHRRCWAFCQKDFWVIDALLDKYADEGIVHIEYMGILNVQPLSDLATPIEIINAFGGRDQYLDALKELEKELYAA